VISPITIRNWVLFHRFIPLSLGAGLNVVEGLGDYDREKRFDMPISDNDTKYKDIEWSGRADYAAGLWHPDGIERDQYRWHGGLAVIRSNPVWFLGVMARRAASMFRYNDSLTQGWPADTAHVNVAALEPTFGHSLEIAADIQPVWTSSPADLIANGKTLSGKTQVVLMAGAQTLKITGEDTPFGDQ